MPEAVDVFARWVSSRDHRSFGLDTSEGPSYLISAIGTDAYRVTEVGTGEQLYHEIHGRSSRATEVRSSSSAGTVSRSGTLLFGTWSDWGNSSLGSDSSFAWWLAKRKLSPTGFDHPMFLKENSEDLPKDVFVRP
jgi:hypothetical protein